VLVITKDNDDDMGMMMVQISICLTTPFPHSELGNDIIKCKFVQSVPEHKKLYSSAEDIDARYFRAYPGIFGLVLVASTETILSSILHLLWERGCVIISW
jgi:hypothetical protein